MIETNLKNGGHHCGTALTYPSMGVPSLMACNTMLGLEVNKGRIWDKHVTFHPVYFCITYKWRCKKHCHLFYINNIKSGCLLHRELVILGVEHTLWSLSLMLLYPNTNIYPVFTMLEWICLEWGWPRNQDLVSNPQCQRTQ